MEIIKTLTGKYLIQKRGKIEYTSSQSKATKFNNGKARVFINCQVSKRDRDNVYVEIIDNQKVDTHKEINITYKSDITSICKKSTKDLKEQLILIRDKLSERLKYYDDSIIDIMHLVGADNAKLNACQLAKVGKEIQKFERLHTATKKELYRVNNVIDKSEEIVQIANTFDYVDYKPRVIKSLDEIF